MGRKIFRDALKSLQREAKARAVSQALKSQGLLLCLPGILESCWKAEHLLCLPPSGNTLSLGLCELAEGVFPRWIADLASLLWCSLVTKTCSTLSTVCPWRMNHRSQGLTGRRKKSCREISDILAAEQQRFLWGSLCTELGQNVCIPFLNKKKNPPNQT